MTAKIVIKTPLPLKVATLEFLCQNCIFLRALLPHSACRECSLMSILHNDAENVAEEK